MKLREVRGQLYCSQCRGRVRPQKLVRLTSTPLHSCSQSIATITEEETATGIDGPGDFSAAQVHAHMSVCKRNSAKNELKKLADPGGAAEMKAPERPLPL